MDSNKFEYADLFVWGSYAYDAGQRYVTLIVEVVSWELVPKLDHLILMIHLPISFIYRRSQQRNEPTLVEMKNIGN
jgi:hypothetical protein